MIARADWISEVVAIHEAYPKEWAPWSRFDREFLALALFGEAGEVANVVKKFWRGDGREAPAAARLIGNLREEIGDTAIYLALVARAWDGKLPAPGRGDAGPMAARSDRVALKFMRATSALCWALTDNLGATAGTVVVPGMVSVVMAMLEALAEPFDLDVDDCVALVLPKVRARFGPALQVAS